MDDKIDDSTKLPKTTNIRRFGDSESEGESPPPQGKASKTRPIIESDDDLDYQDANQNYIVCIATQSVHSLTYTPCLLRSEWFFTGLLLICVQFSVWFSHSSETEADTKL